MNIRLSGLAALIGLVLGSGAMAQTADNSAAANVVGKWVYGPQGYAVGSVRDLTDGGSVATIVVGSYFQPGSHLVRVPARSLSISGGKVTIDSEAAKALNLRSKG